MIIYKTTNLITNKIYIGQDCNNRNEYLGSGIHIKSSIKKYGRDNFRKEIIQYCDSIEELNEREIYWIKYFDSTNPIIGYNISMGGGSIMKGIKQSEETKAKRALSNSGKKRSEETRKKISIANKGKESWAKGKKLSEETKQKISNSHIGILHSDESKMKIAETGKGRIPWNKGKSASEESRKKMSDAKKGKKLGKVHIDKISKSNKGRKNSEESKQNIKKGWLKRKGIIS